MGVQRGVLWCGRCVSSGQRPISGKRTGCDIMKQQKTWAGTRLMLKKLKRSETRVQQLSLLEKQLRIF